tara:strand:- start:2126 stop:2326 length:201 start_codon:yes stop_codon:yes gene_type:complete
VNYLNRLQNIDSAIRKLVKGKQDNKIYIGESGIKNMLNDLTSVIIELEKLYTSIHAILADIEKENN